MNTEEKTLLEISQSIIENLDRYSLNLSDLTFSNYVNVFIKIKIITVKEEMKRRFLKTFLYSIMMNLKIFQNQVGVTKLNIQLPQLENII